MTRYFLVSVRSLQVYYVARVYNITQLNIRHYIIYNYYKDNLLKSLLNWYKRYGA